MSAASERTRNNVRAGMFVAFSLALGLGVFLTLQKLSFEKRTPYRIRFTVAAGVSGLTPGSEVRVGGLQRGVVTSIAPAEEGAIDTLDVHIELSSSIALYENAKAIRVAPLLGNMSWINFVTVGSATVSAADGTTETFRRLDPNGVLNAIEAPGMLTAIVGEKAATQIVTIIDETATFTELLARVPKDYDTRIIPSLDAARDTLVALRDDYARWRVNVDETLTSAASAAKTLDEGTRKATTVVENVQKILDDNAPHLKAALVNVEAAAQSAREAVDAIRTETIPQLGRVLANGDDAITSIATAVDRVDREVAERIPDIRTFFADVRAAAQQLKLATIEVRRSPWRLLYRPSTDVLAHEQLYEAARSFALATGDLRATAESIQALMDARPDFLERDPDTRDRLQRSLLGSLERYEAAQRQLFGVLTKEP